MSSWWRLYCETNGITGSGNSWAKIAANFYDTNNTPACSHPKRLGLLVQAAGSPGLPVPPVNGASAGLLSWGWPSLLAQNLDVAGSPNTLQSSGARAMTLNHGRAPMA